jgi:hypothetical protein
VCFSSVLVLLSFCPPISSRQSAALDEPPNPLDTVAPRFLQRAAEQMRDELAFRQQQPVVARVFDEPATDLDQAYCKLVSGQMPILLGSTSRGSAPKL